MTDTNREMIEQEARHRRALAWRLRNGDAFKALPPIEADEIKQAAAELEAAAAALERLPAGSGWRPIEGAPEGTDVLVHIPTARRRPVRVGRYGLKLNGERLWTYGGEFAFDVGVATAWQPLPAPPTTAPAPDPIDAARREAIKALELIEVDLEAGEIKAALRVKLALSRTKAWLTKLRALLSNAGEG